MPVHLKVEVLGRKRGIRNAAELAKLCKFSTSTAYPIWAGTAARIDIATLNTLLRVLKCRVQDVFTDSESPQSPNPAEPD